jgi:hypothetical protein
MWWSGLRLNHHMYGSLLQTRRFFITLLGRDRLGSRSPGYLLRRLTRQRMYGLLSPESPGPGVAKGG